ncbi:MAG: LuxR C-terminal-related transcriptional regulator [Acidimicrobiales bacterium]|nr:LuxR C-terminal-related transcriptional regulator [Acidimicrobiales bacterium]
MLTSPTTDVPGAVVHVDVRPDALRLALLHVVEEAGWTTVLRATDDAARVSDRVPRPSPGPPLDVLVVPPTARASRRALDAFAAGVVRSIVLTTVPTDLTVALALVRRGVHALPATIMADAHRWPALRPRLERTLHLVLRGRSNADIARSTHQSEATVKRDVADLLRAFDVRNRVALAATVIELGYGPEAA